jgi:ribosome-associated protein YbcJ (S4-like RNA binding protein)
VANRYFVLATGNNNYSNTAMWSANSNGSPTGASVPTSADAILPSTSIATGATFYGDTPIYCASMDWTGATNSPTFNNANALFVYGNLTFISTMTLLGNNLNVIFSGTCILTTGGLSIPWAMILNRTTTVTLGDNLTISATSSNSFRVWQGTFNSNGKNMVMPHTFSADSSQSGAVVLNISGSQITCEDWYVDTANGVALTVDSSSKIIMTGTTFTGGGLTNNEVDLNYAGIITIVGANTFANLVLPSGTTQTVKFPHGVNTTVVSCSLSGSAGHVHTLTTDSGTSTWNLVKSGGGTVTVSYCTITYSVASPATTWYYDGTCTYNSTSGWASYVNPTKNITVAMDALLKYLGDSKTVSLDTRIKATDSQTINLDARIKGTSTPTVNLDALLKGLGITATVNLTELQRATDSKTVALNTLIRTLGITSTVAIDAIIKLIGTATVNLDALIKASGSTTTITLSTLLKALGVSTTIAADILIRTTDTKTINLDTLVKALGVSATTALDTLIKYTDSKTVNLDGLFKAIDSKTVNLDTLIANLGISSNVLLDTILKLQGQQTVSLDTLLKGLGVSTTTLVDTLIKVTDSQTLALDTKFSGKGSVTVSLDTLMQLLGVTQTVAVDAIIKAIDSRTVTLDTIFIGIGSQALLVDAMLRDSGVQAVALDAMIGPYFNLVVSSNLSSGLVITSSIGTGLSISSSLSTGLVIISTLEAH